MHNEETSRAQLLAEMQALRERIRELEATQSHQAQVEASLRESEERYRRMTAAVTDYIFTVRVEDGRAVETVHGPACVAVTGYTAHEFRDDPFLWIRMVHPEDTAAVERMSQQMLGGETPGPVEHRLFRKDGSLRWVRNTLVPRCDAQGRLLSYDGLVSDITERKLAQQALLEREASLASATENVPCMIYQFVQHPDGSIYFPYASAWCREKMGVEPEALRQSAAPLFAHVLKDDYAAFEASIVRSAQTMELWNHEFCAVDKAGAVMRLNGISKPERRRDGSLIWNGVLFDVTQRWRAEQERQSLEAQLAQAQKMEAIGRLAGGVAHDFNNVLTAILGYTELALLDSEELRPHITDSLRQIGRAGERARDLTRQLLAFGRKQTLETRVLDLNGVIKSFGGMLHRLIGEDIEVRMALDRSAGMIRADAAQIEQVLLNLAVNARDAMPDGGVFTIETENVMLDVSHAATLSEVGPGGYVMLSVADTGCGMDQETLKMAFEPFFTTKAHGKGTGLGLATVYGIVKQHNGHILAYSEPGVGTTIKIYLPQASEVEKRNTLPSVPAIPAAVVGGAATVLVVEDDTAVRRLTTAMLTGLGYDVIDAESASAAILLAQQHPNIHLVVADVIMPEMNGRQVYEKLRTVHPDIKVLFVSGYTADIITHRGILEEGVQLLQKPFAVEALAKKVRDVLGG